MRVLLISFIASIIFPALLYSQEDSAVVSKKTYVNVFEEIRLTKIIENYKTTFKLSGYRIQIGSESKTQDSKKIRTNFARQFNNIPTYEIYQQPYYKVRVGDFKTRIEAVKFQNKINAVYPNSFIVKDEIEF